MKKIFFEPGVDSIHDIQAFVLKHLPADPVKTDKTAEIELVIEELVLNTIHHGFKDDKGGTIEVSAVYSDPEFIIEIRDNAKSFNPLENKDPDTLSSLEERAPGGLGIFLAKQMADRITYAYENDHNTLQIVFRI